jgi:NADH-quinone oxidoreductase subunit C
MSEQQTKPLDALQAKVAKQIRQTHSFRGDDTVLIHKGGLREVVRFLRDDPAMDFNYLMDLTAVDYPKDEERFEVVYHFYSLKRNHRIRVKARVSEDDPTIDSLCDLWPAANWYEREAWDMFGVRFNNHPNLKRILMYEEFKGHPLRKDYPIDKRQPLVGPPEK